MSDDSINDNNINDDDLFAKEMAGVKPLAASPRVRLNKDHRSGLAKQAKKSSAQSPIAADNNHLSDDPVALLDNHYVLSFKRDGVQNGVFRKLKQAKYAIEARQDLHRLTVVQAREAVFDFIKEAYQYDLRTVMIVHGKGLNSDSQQALLKSCVNHWLPDMAEVQAFCSAQPKHGGVGAVYVLIKKSERQKQENRDRLTKGAAGD